MENVDITQQKSKYDAIYDILTDSSKWRKTDTCNIFTVKKKILEHHKMSMDLRSIERWIKILTDIQSKQRLNGCLIVSSKGEKLFVKKEISDGI